MLNFLNIMEVAEHLPHISFFKKKVDKTIEIQQNKFSY